MGNVPRSTVAKRTTGPTPASRAGNRTSAGNGAGLPNCCVRRRHGLAWLVGVIAGAAAVGNAEEPSPAIEVFQEATCDCCMSWVRHLESAGFKVEVTAFENPFDLQAIKREQGISTEISACHTASVGGYVIEGHVSASEIRRLLEERPAIKGLVVPRMPKGAPGIESDEPQRYEVLALDPEGRTWTVHIHEPLPSAVEPGTDGSAAPGPGAP